jgi:hypothetical protein
MSLARWSGTLTIEQILKKRLTAVANSKMRHIKAATGTEVYENREPTLYEKRATSHSCVRAHNGSTNVSRTPLPGVLDTKHHVRYLMYVTGTKSVNKLFTIKGGQRKSTLAVLTFKLASLQNILTPTSVSDSGCLTRIPDPGFFPHPRSRIHNNKKRRKNLLFYLFFVSINFTKLKCI